MRILHWLLSLVVCGTSVWLVTPTTATQTPPNVVVILADDLEYGDLSSYGHRTLKTPALDRLAREGIRFTSFYAASPLCSPSRAALLTGRTPFRSGIQSWIPPDEDIQLGRREITLATVLKRQGYQTFLSGKWHLNGGLDNTRHLQPSDHGFEQWLALHAWAIPHHRNPTNFYRNGKPVGEIQEYAAAIVVDEALAMIERRRRDAPFFLYLAFAEPHGTIASPDRFNAQYAAHTAGRPDPVPNAGRVPDNLAARGPGEYYANVSHLDYQVGRLLERLDRLGLRESTLVLFTSDNGPVTRDWRHWYEINLAGVPATCADARKICTTGASECRRSFGGPVDCRPVGPWTNRCTATMSCRRLQRSWARPYPRIVQSTARTSRRCCEARRSTGRGRSIGSSTTRTASRSRYGMAGGSCWLIGRSRGFELFDMIADRFEVVDRAGDEPEVVGRLLDELRRRRAEVETDPLRPRAGAPKAGGA